MGLPVAIDTAERAEPRVAWPGRALPAKPWTTAASSIAMIPSIGGGTLIPKGWQLSTRPRACSLLHAPCASSQVGLRTMATRSHVGAQVDSAAVREVAGRLLEEGRSRLDTAPESALVALRQAFSLEQQFGVDGERLHRTAC